MTRRLLNLLTLLSLLLCVATVGLWVRNHWVADYILWQQPFDLEMTTDDGRLRISFAPGSPADAPQRREWMSVPGTSGEDWAPPGPTPLGFGFFHGERGLPFYRNQSGLFLLAYVQLWFLAALFGSGPAVRAIRVLRRRRIRPGFCPACGYDLRATPDRCPECGNFGGNQ